MKLSCSERCLRYLKHHEGKLIPSGKIQRLAQAKSEYTGSYVSRELRKLAQSGEIQVQQLKGHAHYMYTGGDLTKRLSAWNFDTV